MRRRLLFAGLLVLVSQGAPALADDVPPAADLLTCSPTRSEVARVSVENLHYGVTATYLWASGMVRLQLRDHSERTYALNGRATPFNRLLSPNAADASFAYPGFRCVVQYPFITAVRNCAGQGKRKSCDVGLDVGGTQYSYAVSLTADRVKNPVLEASATGAP